MQRGTATLGNSDSYRHRKDLQGKIMLHVITDQCMSNYLCSLSILITVRAPSGSEAPARTIDPESQYFILRAYVKMLSAISLYTCMACMFVVEGRVTESGGRRDIRKLRLDRCSIVNFGGTLGVPLPDGRF